MTPVPPNRPTPTKTQQVLQAIARGHETVADIDAALSGTMSRYHIAALVAHLKARGLVTVIGRVIPRADRGTGRRVGPGRVRFRYAVVVHTPVITPRADISHSHSHEAL